MTKAFWPLLLGRVGGGVLSTQVVAAKLRRSRSPRSFQQPAFVTQDGYLVTNAALRRAPSVDQRHQCDYTFCCPELPSVTSTAAANDNSFLRAVDATDASFSKGESTAVGTPQQIAT